MKFSLCSPGKWTRRDLEGDILEQINKKSQQALTNNFVNNLYKTIKPKKDLIKIAIVSDLHMQYDYVPGSSSQCGKIQCCRSDSGPGLTPETTAGKWGHYRCDLNVLTLNSMLDFIRKDISPRAVIWAGDSVGHNLDSLSIDDVVFLMLKTTSLV